MTTSGDWIQYQHQTIAHGSDGDAAFSVGLSDGMSSPSHSSSGAGQLPSPTNAVGGASKLVRKRSRARASTKTPATTTLNCNPTNFRALVQQFTGCPNNSAPPGGAVTLSFGKQGGGYGHETPAIPSPFSYINSQSPVYSQHQQQQLQLQLQQQRSIYGDLPFGEDQGFLVPTSNCTGRFMVDNVSGFGHGHGHGGNSPSDGDGNDGYFF